MPADTSSPLLQLLVMQTGNDNNAWGDNFNTSILTPLENAIAGQSSLTITGGSHTLTDDEARPAVMFLSGVLTADQTLVCANRAKNWKIFNNTTGNFYVLLKTASGTAINLPRGKVTQVFCDGANGVYRGDRERVGNLFFHAGTTAPSGALECDGTTYLRASLVDLYAAIGTTWGNGDGVTTFPVPPGKDTGRFVRSRTNAVTIGTSQANQNLLHSHSGTFSGGFTDNQGNHAHSGSGNTSGQSNDHTHTTTINASVGNNYTGGGGGIPVSVGASVNTSYAGLATGTVSADHFHSYSFTTSTNGLHSHNVSGTVTVGNSGGTEARPEAIVGMLCIWY